MLSQMSLYDGGKGDLTVDTEGNVILKQHIM